MGRPQGRLGSRACFQIDEPPVVAELDEAERATFVEAIQQDVGATLRSYTHDDAINFPMAAYVAMARIPPS